ncbi:MAG: DNA repair protein [Labilithrix sp.]|nr:DNA repair protein [Labilithrix sp.]
MRDLVAVVARRGARTLLERAGGLERLARAEAFEIAAHLEGRDPDTREAGATIAEPGPKAMAAARAIAAAFELGRRVERARATAGVRVFDSGALVRWATPRLGSLAHEEVWLLALDGNMHLRAARCVARGGLHGAAMRAADPVRAAIRLDASAFLLVHNHPSGDPTPSAEDIAATRRIAAVAAIADIPLLDHVVIARSGHVSIEIEEVLIREAG